MVKADAVGPTSGKPKVKAGVESIDVYVANDTGNRYIGGAVVEALGPSTAYDEALVEARGGTPYPLESGQRAAVPVGVDFSAFKERGAATLYGTYVSIDPVGVSNRADGAVVVT